MFVFWVGLVRESIAIFSVCVVVDLASTERVAAVVVVLCVDSVRPGVVVVVVVVVSARVVEGFVSSTPPFAPFTGNSGPLFFFVFSSSFPNTPVALLVCTLAGLVNGDLGKGFR